MTSAAGQTAAALVVGGGISGMAAAAACAARSTDDAPVVVLDRGRRLGGRMAARTLRSGPWAGHVVDLGAAYFTVSHPDFAAIVADWQRRGLVREWTDTFAVAGPDGIVGTSTGPMRYAARDGLRSLVEDLATQHRDTVLTRYPAEATWVAQVAGSWRIGEIATAGGPDSEPAALTALRVALCVPPPQAVEILATPPAPGLLGAATGPVAPTDDVESLWWAAEDYTYDPILALVAQWPGRCWDDFRGCFVNDDEVLSFIADDGDRRGDEAAVLVAHSTPAFAAGHLLDPQAAAEELRSALCRVLGVAPPASVEVKRWALARPTGTDPVGRDAALLHQPLAGGGGSFLLAAGGSIGIASDAFDARPRIEAAWLSGHLLGIALSSPAGTA